MTKINCKKQIHIVRIVSITLMLTTISLFSGCIKEDLSNCFSSVILKYKYELNMAYADKFATEVGNLQTFIFDDNGILIDTLKPLTTNTINEYSHGINLKLNPGNYTALTWASDVNLYQDYHISKTNNFPALSPSGLEIGQTTIEDIRLFLNYTTAQPFIQASNNLTAKPNRDNFNNLYHGLVENFTVKNSGYTEVVTPLIKNTNTINIIITNLHLLNATSNHDDFDISIRSNNGHYKYKNTILEQAHNIIYNTYTREINSDSLTSSMKIMRLMKTEIGPFNNALTLLNITYTPDNREICKDMNLVDLILSAKIPARDSLGNIIRDNDGNIMYTQPSLEYLDRQDSFNIKFDIAKTTEGTLTFTVYVDNWKIQNIYPIQ